MKRTIAMCFAGAVVMMAGVAVAQSVASEEDLQGWIVRNGQAVLLPDGLRVVSTAPRQPTFLAQTFPEKLELPLKVEIEARAGRATVLSLEWISERKRGPSGFVKDPNATLDIPAGPEWTWVRTTIPAGESIELLRILLEGTGEIPVAVRCIRLTTGSDLIYEYSFSR